MVTIKNYICNAFQQNTYLVVSESTNEAVLIDCGCNSETQWYSIGAYIRQNNLTLKYILLTHGHVDHVMGTRYPVRDFHAPVCGSLDEEQRLPDGRTQATLFGVKMVGQPAPITRDVQEGDLLTLGDEEIRVLDVPGHSFHGLCYYFPQSQVVFTGDVLFCAGVGRSDFGAQWGCNGTALAEGIANKLFTLPDETQVYPGHGPRTNIDFERENNPYV
jgi:glyoxylase-like metal-dependent hydrolase (beta-lactamase superfamily II)